MLKDNKAKRPTGSWQRISAERSQRMCDFSLEMYRTRPAREGEKYISTRFASGTIGLTAIGDNSMVVCVQCDTQLELEGLPREVQETLGVGPKEEVTFVRLEHGPFRDGVRFKNGKELSLQQLKPGVTVTVLKLLETAAPALDRAVAV
jgi:hypothetical protein